MPNIRIAFMISQFGCDVRMKVCNGRTSSGDRNLEIPEIGEREIEVREIGVPEMTDESAPPAAPERKPLTPAARRALAEAEARRRAAEAHPHPAAAREFQG